MTTKWFVCGVLLISTTAWADSTPKVAPEGLQQLKNLEEEAKKMGPWASEAQVITEAHHIIFEQNGWDSEPDQFMLNLINQVSQVAPWDPAQREQIFFTGVQGRYNLTQDQVELVKREANREAMMVAVKHFKDVVPIALEVARTRVSQKPFTAEQVQKWSHKLEPVMADALQSVERISQKLEKTMNEGQRAQLEEDMKAVLKRHRDVEKMIKSWKAGHWNPMEWGLHHDAVHAAAVSEHLRLLAERDGLVDRKRSKDRPDLASTATDQSAWELYVNWFCNYYKCNDLQRGIANSILKSETKNAVNYLAKYGKEIEMAEALREHAETEANRKKHAARAEQLRKPIGAIFNRLCARLEKQVLTLKQQELVSAEKTAQAQKKAGVKN
ncbi:MAG: hypothetical protein MI923_13840 [Phycisphaerales bacterium]|nr:hypothetical protein [Phycisphaerales bacterium]